MKKFFLKVFPLLFVTLSIATSCSNEINDESTKNKNESSNLFARISSEDGSLEFENKTVTINKTGFSKYVNDSLKYDFEYISEIDYVIDETEDVATVSNIDDNNESFKIKNFRVEEDRIVFDVLTSDNKLFENIKYYADSETLNEAKFCYWCVLVPVVLEALTDLLNESECQTAINACLKAGGLPSTTITSGLFGNSCTVVCKPK